MRANIEIQFPFLQVATKHLSRHSIGTRIWSVYLLLPITTAWFDLAMRALQSTQSRIKQHHQYKAEQQAAGSKHLMAFAV